MKQHPQLPLIGSTNQVQDHHTKDYWRSVFGELWGEIDLQEVSQGQLSGHLQSRKIGDLTFNRIEFGNQQFERYRQRSNDHQSPFYSLSFPEQGSAFCQIANQQAQLIPNHAYLLNNSFAAKLRVEEHYTTFNVKIPTEALEHRLGNNPSILSRAVLQSDAIYHILQVQINQLLHSETPLSQQSSEFISNQMLDTIAFFLTCGDSPSEDSYAIQAVRARVVSYIEQHFYQPDISPETIAKACRISRSYLYKVFSDDLSVMERIRNRRLDAAVKLLQRKTLHRSMTDIAMSCGFSNPSEFSRLFKSKYGVAPSKY